jgi:hypothetical protein
VDRISGIDHVLSLCRFPNLSTRSALALMLVAGRTRGAWMGFDLLRFSDPEDVVAPY